MRPFAEAGSAAPTYVSTMKAYNKACEYSYRIRWSHDDHGYVATVAEFPALRSPAAPTPHAALDALTAAVEHKLVELDLNGEPRPLALALS